MHAERMLQRISKTISWIAGLYIGCCFAAALSHSGADMQPVALVKVLPAFIINAVAAVYTPWGLAAASFWLGLVARAAAQSWTDYRLGRYGGAPLRMVRFRMGLLSARHAWPTLRVFVNEQRELELLNAEFTNAAIGFPPLPTTSPQHPDMQRTVFYLRQARQYLYPGRLVDGRKALTAIVSSGVS